jgi:hypothetical protein
MRHSATGDPGGTAADTNTIRLGLPYDGPTMIANLGARLARLEARAGLSANAKTRSLSRFAKAALSLEVLLGVNNPPLQPFYVLLGAVITGVGLGWRVTLGRSALRAA